MYCKCQIVDQTDPTIECESPFIEINTTDEVTLTTDLIIPPLSFDDNCGDEDVVIQFSQSTFTCPVQNGDFDITITAMDKSLNESEPCTVEVRCRIIDDIIKGRIASVDGNGLVNVEMQLRGKEELTIITDELGNYLFEELKGGESYILRPTKRTSYLNGVSTFDIVLASQHILGTSEFTNAHQFIAADVNKDGKVSGLDVVQMRQLILNKIDQFPSNDSWRFIDENHRMPEDLNPLKNGFPESYLVQELVGDMEINFTGIKVGDINGDAPQMIDQSRELGLLRY